MNEVQKKHFCEILLAWKAELMEEVEHWIEAEMHRLDPEAYAGN